jgi:zinc transporter
MAVKEGCAYDGAKPKGGEGPLPGLVWAFLFHPDGSSEELSVDRPIASHLDGWLWLHFDLPDGQAPQVPKPFSKLPRGAVDLLAASDQRQQLHVDEGCIFGVFANLIDGRDKPDKGFGFVHFAMTERLLVSNRGQAVEGLGATREALLRGRKIATVAGLLIAIVEHVIETVDEYAEQLGGALDEIEEKVVAGEAGDERATLAESRRNAVRLHRQLVMSRSLINRFEFNPTGPSLPFDLPIGKISQRLDWLDSEVVALRDRAHLLQEEVTLSLAEQTNRHLEVLSIVATVFLPAGLVAGIFGMNVKGLPLTDTDYGFLWSMGILVGASVLVYWLLRRAGAISRKTP